MKKHSLINDYVHLQAVLSLQVFTIFYDFFNKFILIQKINNFL